MKARCWSCAAAFGVGIDHGTDPHRGRPVGLIANNSRHLGGAIDADGADKAARFMQLCDAFGLPIVSLCDTPGFMVGPEVEKTAQVRHVSRMFVTAANDRAVSSPWCCARATASARRRWPAARPRAVLHAWPGRPASSAAWAWKAPSASAYRKELEAIEDPAARKAWFDDKVAQAL
jgi:acetyl-CoA carboxylase carboxyltransferase component